jgi:hypothetical protein
MNPTSDYNFKRIAEKNGLVFYYTKPIKAYQYTNADNVVEQYDKSLKHVGEKKWIWIIDSEGFNLKHAMEVTIGTEIAKLITEKHAHNLQEIKIINPTWHIKTILTAIMPFIDKQTKQKINVLNDRQYSVLEFI